MSHPNTIQIRINKQKKILTSLYELEQVLKQNNNTQLVEYLLEGHDESSLICLLNPSHAFLVFMRYNGDSGFSSSNLEGNNDRFQPFSLSNGQADEYADSQIIDRKLAYEAMKFYFLTGKMYPNIDWQEA